jgi:hypothetical protein
MTGTGVGVGVTTAPVGTSEKINNGGGEVVSNSSVEVYSGGGVEMEVAVVREEVEVVRRGGEIIS